MIAFNSIIFLITAKSFLKMSNMFDIYIRSYEDDSPILTLTLDRNGYSGDKNPDQDRAQAVGCQLKIWDLKTLIHDKVVVDQTSGP